MSCSQCGAAVQPGMKFCPECGVPLGARCPSCGAEHVPGQKFCAECGQPLAQTGAAGGAGGGRAATSPQAGGGAPGQPGASASAPPPPPPSDAAEMRLVSVLFVDLVGFTALSESRDAADVRDLLGSYFEQARTIVERYGGTIEKFIGDAVMAVWGVPAAREDDAERAVRAALDVVDAVRVFGAEIDAPEVRARAGVVTGQVAALDNPGEGLVVGDRVNTASRVQSAAEPGSVLVDEVTRGATSASIVYEDAGEHVVKGKAEPLRLWRALRVVAGMGGNQREQGLDPPFVGRDADLRLLKELFHQSLDRRSARLVAVFGEAGIGKSRLRREFFQYIDGLAGTVLWHSGRCLSYGEGVAYWALAEMVRQRFGIPEDAPPEEAGDKLAAGIERWVPEAGDRQFLAPRLGALLGLAEPGLGREELFAGWRMLFERLAAHEPVVLAFEDLQWADRGLLEFIEQLLDWSSSSPIFIVTLARPELAERHGGWPAGHRAVTILQLEPLDEGAMHELLTGVVDGLPPAAASRIIAQAAGVPLYAVETLRALLDRGIVSDRDGRLALVGDLGELDVPASLGSLLAARIDALEPGERRLVKAMSVFGGAFPRATAAALGDVDEAELDRLLAGLVRKQVLAIRADPLSPDRGQYAFAQGLLRTVAYEMLSRQERKLRHVAAAEHLRQAFPNAGEEVAEAIAAHLLDAYEAAQDDSDAADLRAQAVAALRRAGNRAAAVGAPETAQRSFLAARELVDDSAERAELCELAADMLVQFGEIDTALALFEEAAGIHSQAGGSSKVARLAAKAGHALVIQGRNEEAVARVSDALEAFDSEQLDAVVGGLHAVLGRAYVWLGREELATRAFERALQIAEALELPDLLAATLEAKASLYSRTGRVREARLLYDGAIEIAEPLGLGFELNRARTNSGNLSLQWDLPGAEELCRTALDAARRRGERRMETVIGGNLLTLLILTGRWDEAARLGTELLGDNPGRAGVEFFNAGLAVLHAYRGEAAEAAAAIEGLARWATVEDIGYRSLRLAAIAVVAQLEGRTEDALNAGAELLPETVEVLSAATDAVRMAWAETLEAALALGRLDDARTVVGLLDVLPPGHIPPYLRAELARGRALLAAAERRHDEVEGELQGAIDALDALAYPYHCARARTDLGQWLIEQGRASEAEPLLSSAIQVLERLRARPELERALRIAGRTPETAGSTARAGGGRTAEAPAGAGASQTVM